MTQKPSPTLDFWYEFASPYSYPVAMRIDALAKASNVTVNWKPFLLGPVFSAQGWQDSPFNLYPAKGAYMWRDMERICQQQGIPFQRPQIFPARSVLAAKVAMTGASDGWIAPYSRAVYTAVFALDMDIFRPETIRSILADLDLNAAQILDRAQTGEGAHLRQQTEGAIKRGIFGAPSFTVGAELFWGGDRLQSAINWALDST